MYFVCSSCLFVFLMIRRPPRSTLFPTRRSSDLVQRHQLRRVTVEQVRCVGAQLGHQDLDQRPQRHQGVHADRKSTRLNSSHGYISYAVFCLKKKNNLSTPNYFLTEFSNFRLSAS